METTWPDRLAGALGVPALSAEAVELILALTRDVAHGTERVNGPVATFLVGLAAAQSEKPVEAVLRQAMVTADRLIGEEA